MERSRNKYVPKRLGEKWMGKIDHAKATAYCCSVFFFNLFFFICCRGITDEQLDAIWEVTEFGPKYGKNPSGRGLEIFFQALAI